MNDRDYTHKMPLAEKVKLAGLLLVIMAVYLGLLQLRAWIG